MAPPLQSLAAKPGWLTPNARTNQGWHQGGREEEDVAKEDRGFASMDRAKQREIASKGGKAAHQKGTAHEWTSEEARDAGRKGGIASHRRRREQMGLGGGAGTDRADDRAMNRGESRVDRDQMTETRGEMSETTDQ
jgi:general stress protein YciG